MDMLKKKLLVLLLSASMAMTMLAGCGSNTDKKDDTKTEASKDDASEAKTDSKDANLWDEESQCIPFTGKFTEP